MSTVVTNIGTVTIIETSGQQGPPGAGMPAGGTIGQVLVKATNTDYALTWADPASISNVMQPAVTSLSGHVVVRAVPAGVDVADSSDITHASTVLGITTGAASIGAAAIVQTSGVLIEPSWAFTQGLPVFLGTAGQLTQTQPLTGFSLIVGTALSATSLFINIQAPIILN